MTFETIRSAARTTALAAAIGIAVSLAPAPAFAGPQPTPKPSTPAPEEALPNLAEKPRKGDLDGMIKRRMIRVLVSPSRTHYFVDAGTQRGIIYDAFKLFESDLNKQLKKGQVGVHIIFLPVSSDQFIPRLLEGRGDIAAANFTITPERLEKVDFTDPSTKNVADIVVTGPNAPPLASLEDLSGKEVYVRRSSSFYGDLEALNARLAKSGKPPVKLRLAPEVLRDEDILEMVNAGLVPMTISQDHIAAFWKQVFPKITLHPGAALRSGTDLGWMIRKQSPELKAALDSFLARNPVGSSTRNQLLQKYLKNAKYARSATSGEDAARFQSVITLFRKYSDKYDLDYLLVAAQGYQESRLDQNAKSAVGAVGVMQVMPPTGKDMGVGDITQLEPNIHAGIKYVRWMMTNYYGDEPMDRLNKGLFTFAAYNAGPGRISGLRKIAKQRGLDPNVWFNNVEIIASEKIGRETVTYVSNIYKYYLAYQLVVEQQKEREAARAKARSEVPKP